MVIDENCHKNVSLHFGSKSEKFVLDSVGTPCECEVVRIVAKKKPIKNKSGILEIDDSDDEKPKMLADTTLKIECFGKKNWEENCSCHNELHRRDN